ncbi:MAG: hypothetical protein VKP70_05170 [Cyanobacteriota bacterium]|nr:hypothetical protein [Cyanobacteriota bacterium]
MKELLRPIVGKQIEPIAVADGVVQLGCGPSLLGADGKCRAIGFPQGATEEEKWQARQTIARLEKESMPPIRSAFAHPAILPKPDTIELIDGTWFNNDLSWIVETAWIDGFHNEHLSGLQEHLFIECQVPFLADAAGSRTGRDAELGPVFRGVSESWRQGGEHGTGAKASGEAKELPSLEMIGCHCSKCNQLQSVTTVAMRKHAIIDVKSYVLPLWIGP